MEAILAELDREQAVSVAQLCRATGASGATIRRDLNELARRGKLNKVYGGAMSIREEFRAGEPDMEVKRELHTQEKLRIARYAASLIQDGDVVFLDAGSTVMHMVDHIQASGAVFVTNSVECVQRLPLRGLRTYVLGGVIKPGTLAVIGGEAMEALKTYNFTKAFLGANGVTIAQGFTTPDPEEAAVKALAAERAQEVYVLADSSKFGQVTAAVIFPIDAACVITDRLPDRRYKDYTDVREV